MLDAAATFASCAGIARKAAARLAERVDAHGLHPHARDAVPLLALAEIFDELAEAAAEHEHGRLEDERKAGHG